jgi:hypothetical protein
MEAPPRHNRAAVLGYNLGLVALGAILGRACTFAVLRGDFPWGARDSSPIEVSSRLGCVETVITEVKPGTDSSGAGSGYIGFRDDIAPGHGAHDMNIMGVSLAYTTYVPLMNVGDHARVCLLSVPEKQRDVPGGCNPEYDARGRRFLIYDRASQVFAQYSYGVHGCGGA